METLQFAYRNGRPVAGSPSATLTGVVGSGNLEVLVESTDLGGACRIEILTAAVGFGPIWQAVLDDFFARHPLADVRISLHHVGAPPPRGPMFAFPSTMSAPPPPWSACGWTRRSNRSPEPSHEAQLLRGQCPRTPPRASRRRQLF